MVLQIIDADGNPATVQTHEGIPDMVMTGGGNTSEGYCVRCRIKQPMFNAWPITNKRGAAMEQAYCPKPGCNTVINRFMKKTDERSPANKENYPLDKFPFNEGALAGPPIKKKRLKKAAKTMRRVELESEPLSTEQESPPVPLKAPESEVGLPFPAPQSTQDLTASVQCADGDAARTSSPSKSDTPSRLSSSM